MYRVLAIDCEMVGSGDRNLLARVAIIGERGRIILDEYVKPTATVTDYRSYWSGIKQKHLENGKDFSTVRSWVANLISGCILVGHSLQNDLDVLELSHPEHMKRDFAKYKPFLQSNGGQPVALKTLAGKYLGVLIQSASHDPIEDATICRDLYLIFPDNW